MAGDEFSQYETKPSGDEFSQYETKAAPAAAKAAPVASTYRPDKVTNITAGPTPASPKNDFQSTGGNPVERYVNQAENLTAEGAKERPVQNVIGKVARGVMGDPAAEGGVARAGLGRIVGTMGTLFMGPGGMTPAEGVAPAPARTPVWKGVTDVPVPKAAEPTPTPQPAGPQEPHVWHPNNPRVTPAPAAVHPSAMEGFMPEKAPAEPMPERAGAGPTEAEKFPFAPPKVGTPTATGAAGNRLVSETPLARSTAENPAWRTYAGNQLELEAARARQLEHANSINMSEALKGNPELAEKFMPKGAGKGFTNEHLEIASKNLTGEDVTVSQRGGVGGVRRGEQFDSLLKKGYTPQEIYDAGQPGKGVQLLGNKRFKAGR